MNIFFRAPLVLTAWQQLFLFSKAAQHGPSPFVACSRGWGLCKFQGLWCHQPGRKLVVVPIRSRRQCLSFALNGVTSSVAELNCGSVASPHWRCSRQKLKTFQVPMQASANQIALCKYPSADASQSRSRNTRKVMWLAVVTMTVASAPSFRHTLCQALTLTPCVNRA